MSRPPHTFKVTQTITRPGEEPEISELRVEGAQSLADLLGVSIATVQTYSRCDQVHKLAKSFLHFDGTSVSVTVERTTSSAGPADYSDIYG